MREFIAKYRYTDKRRERDVHSLDASRSLRHCWPLKLLQNPLNYFYTTLLCSGPASLNAPASLLCPDQHFPEIIGLLPGEEAVKALLCACKSPYRILALSVTGHRAKTLKSKLYSTPHTSATRSTASLPNIKETRQRPKKNCRRTPSLDASEEGWKRKALYSARILQYLRSMSRRFRQHY